MRAVCVVAGLMTLSLTVVSAAVPGLGWGSPIVWGEHVFVTSVIGDEAIPKPGLVIEDERPDHLDRERARD